MPNLIKIYTDERQRFIRQIRNNTHWKKSFTAMRLALHQCIKELNLRQALQQYYSLYVLMQECSPENNIVIAGTLTELVVESGWLLFDRNHDKQGDPIFLSILDCISTAVMHYNCINSVYADILLENKLSSESEAYYQAACTMITDFLEKLYLSKIKHTIDVSPLVNETRKHILKIATLKIDKNEYKKITVLLLQYEEISSKYSFTKNNEIEIERSCEYNRLKEWLKKQKEIKRCKEKIKIFPLISTIDDSLNIDFLMELLDFLESEKEGEFSIKILDEINLRQSKISEKQTLINRANEEILDNIISEILLEDLCFIANEVIQSPEPREITSDLNTINTSLEEISDISLSCDGEISRNLVEIPHANDERPYCAQDRYSEFFCFFSIILEKYNCDAFLFGSANYKKYPNDLDILLNNDIKITNALMGELILNQGANILANYKKINRRVVRMCLYGLIIDFILSNEDILQHSKRLDFTIGAVYYDLRRKIMFFPYPHSLQHIQIKQLQTISDARQMFENDPSVIFRAARIMASENFTLSKISYLAIKETFLIKNVFLTMNPDKLYHEMVQLFFSGHAVRTLEILVNELKIFQYIFTRLHELSQPMYSLTLSILECIADMSDDYFQNSSQYFYPPPPSLFYYAVHWFIFIKDNIAQSSYPRINLIQGQIPSLNNTIDYNNRKDLYALEYYHQILPENVSFKEYYCQSRNSFWSNKIPVEQSFNQSFNPS